ncbi:metallophosphoesterase-like protein [Xylariomycetidae sp. FL2044]|nr:metallophosphoesterase-like protein [Xylariomycetidae sp. FL2044]
MKKLYAIGDLHLGYEINKKALLDLEPHPGDGLILVGDVGETAEHLEFAFGVATRNFDQVFWCPGNHELYTIESKTSLRGEAKYAECVEAARRFGVHTPEDDFFRWEGGGDDGGSSDAVLVAPIFTLYDYTFRPAHLQSKEEALRWAEEANTVATDEFLLHADPHPSREDWCRALVAKTRAKLERAARETGLPLVVVNHWPLREDLVYIPRVPRFVLWCGTKATEEWHREFGASVVVSGHLHVPRTDWKDGVRFEECSLGYPPQWAAARDRGKDINDLLREVWPGPPPPETGNSGTQWRRYG